MYTEALSLGEPASAQVDAAAKFVQWAQFGILSGASKNDATIRYNLNAFWSLKAQTWGNASQAERAQLERLDVLAHGLWNALETGKVISAPPGYASFWASTVFGGTPSRPGAVQAAQGAASATAGLSAAADRARFLQAYAAQERASLGARQKAGDDIWSRKAPGWFGIPWWAWAAGVVGLGLIVYMRGTE